MMNTQASETSVDDHLRNLIRLMKRGARIKLFDIPDDPSLLVSNIGGGMSQAIARRLEAALSAAEPVSSIVPKHCSGTSLVFQGGCLHVRTDGSGHIVVDEDDFKLEDDRQEGEQGPEGSVHWIARFPAGEMTALRDFLNGQDFPTLSVQVQDESEIVDCLLAGKPFVFDPATNFCHADDGGAPEHGIKYVPAAQVQDVSGWQLVPTEPTDEMHNAARDWAVRKYGLGIGRDGSDGCYRAMLAAAPAKLEGGE